MDFSKMDAGKMVLEVRPFRLDKLLYDLSVIVSATVNRKPVEVLFDIDPAAPQALSGDMQRLHQVLLNLCSNAVKFTAQGEVVAKISVVRQSGQQVTKINVLRQSGQQVTLRFAVRDTGIGIAAENPAAYF